MSTWILAIDFDRLRTTAGTEAARRTAEVIAENYSYPVDTIVLAKDLEVLAQFAANDMFGPGGYQPYDQFLTGALTEEK